MHIIIHILTIASKVCGIRSSNDTYYTDDNINYHMSWLKCARDEHSELNIDYIGAWNERSWGNPDWIIQFRQAMDDEGFNNTKIIIPDAKSKSVAIHNPPMERNHLTLIIATI